MRGRGHHPPWRRGSKAQDVHPNSWGIILNFKGEDYVRVLVRNDGEHVVVGIFRDSAINMLIS